MARVAECLYNAGAAFVVFHEVMANLTVAVVEKCREYAESIKADFLVAVGGGSPIDTAKAAGILLTNGGKVQDYEGVGKSSRLSLPLIVVNTTAGTGSEVTNFYIITDEIKHSKMCMVDDNCIPVIAVNDSGMMLTMPKGLTAATGMDALTHSIEALMSKSRNPLSDKDAMWAVSVIFDYLPRAYVNGGDIEARDYMACAANIAGMAFSNSGLGLVHAMAHSLGGFYNLPNGLCNAILLPWVMRFNSRYPVTHNIYKNIYKAIYKKRTYQQ